jgi:hypothetical protein
MSLEEELALAKTTIEAMRATLPGMIRAAEGCGIRDGGDKAGGVCRGEALWCGIQHDGSVRDDCAPAEIYTLNVRRVFGSVLIWIL